jgi:hypothetical protein
MNARQIQTTCQPTVTTKKDKVKTGLQLINEGLGVRYNNTAVYFEHKIYRMFIRIHFSLMFHNLTIYTK